MYMHIEMFKKNWGGVSPRKSCQLFSQLFGRLFNQLFGQLFSRLFGRLFNQLFGLVNQLVI